MFILFCLFDINYFSLFFFLYMVFLKNKNGLLNLTPICQGGKKAFGLSERSSSLSEKTLLVSDRHCSPPADWTAIAWCPLSLVNSV